MHVRKKALVALACLGVGSSAGWYYFSHDENNVKVEESGVRKAVSQEDLSPDLKTITDKNKPKALVELYRLNERVFDERGLKMEPRLVSELGIKNYPVPLTAGLNQEMTDILYRLFERPDGTTNETKDVYTRILEQKDLESIQSSFKEWEQGNKENRTLEQEWDEVLKNARLPLKSSVAFAYSFEHEKNLFHMLSKVKEEVGNRLGTTSPHVLDVSVSFDPESKQYKLYFAGSEVE